jgi:hypothetical protein
MKSILGDRLSAKIVIRKFLINTPNKNLFLCSQLENALPHNVSCEGKPPNVQRRPRKNRRDVRSFVGALLAAPSSPLAKALRSAATCHLVTGNSPAGKEFR